MRVEIEAKDYIKRHVRAYQKSTSGHIYVPKEWKNREVIVILPNHEGRTNFGQKKLIGKDKNGNRIYRVEILDEKSKVVAVYKFKLKGFLDFCSSCGQITVSDKPGKGIKNCSSCS